MIFGIPKELSESKGSPEMRVGLSPMGVRELVHDGAEVYVETNAGAGAGFSNEDYEKAGASIVFSKEEAYKRSDIVLKVRRPQPEEFSLIKDGQVIMGYMHLFTSPRGFFDVVKEKQLTLIGYEIIQDENGEMPMVIPMSEVAGKLSVQIAAHLLESQEGGRGILLGGIAGIPPAEVVILGGGTLGRSAARTFAGIGANVYVLDVDRAKLERIAYHTSGMKITTVFSTRHNLEKLVKFADVLVGGVMVPRKRAPRLITREMIQSMRKGAVFMDFSIDQGGCSETSKNAPLEKFVYSVHDVIHFCIPNATTLVARTATHTLTTCVFPYLTRINKMGFDAAIAENEALARGICSEKGDTKEEFLT